jgi:predicted NUDIX family NTP pyrophosphohydrolase
MPKLSAGLLLYRAGAGDAVEVLIAHMGGPFWAKKDAGAWSIPKGEYEEGEDPLAVARREFQEELGQPAPAGEPVLLGAFRQSGGKRVTVYAQEGDCDVTEISSSTFTVEWPPRSGQLRSFPEVDRAEWTSIDAARERLVKGQVAALDALVARVGDERA